MEDRVKFDHTHGLPPSASEPELLLELIIKEAPTEGCEEVIPLEGSATTPPLTFLKLKFWWKLRISYQNQKNYDLPQIMIEASITSTIMTTAMILKNAFDSEMKSRSSLGEVGWIDSSDASLKQEKINQGHCHSQNNQWRRNNKEVGHLPASSILSLGGLVLRRAIISQPQGQVKLAPNWEGQHKIEEIARPKTCHLKELGGTMLPWP